MSFRSFCTSSILKQYSTPRAVKKANFDKNFNVQKPVKAWERAGEDKDTFFKKRYAHVHAEQMKRRDPEIEQRKRDKKMQYRQEQSLEKQQRRRRTSEGKTYVSSFQNPLSEFVYGTSAVLAALTSDKRSSFSRLLFQGANKKDEQLLKIAKAAGVAVQYADKHQLNLLSNYSPHNGVVLETRPVDLQKLVSLGVSSEGTYDILEDRNGEILQESLSVVRAKNLYPLGVMIDEVTDPHNIGAIIRSAYFLGADFVVVCEKNCAPLNPVVAKASSGAMDLMKVFSTSHPIKLIQDSQASGWLFVSTAVNNHHKNRVDADNLNVILQNSPCVMMLGSEGEGLRKSLLNMTDYQVTLSSGRQDILEGRSLVDSLNVSVASALLLSKFLQ